MADVPYSFERSAEAGALHDRYASLGPGEESEDVVYAFLRSHPEFELQDLQAEYPQWAHPAAGSFLPLTPHRDGTDGFFIARLRRR